MVQLLWSSEDESSLWQSDLARERPSVRDPSVGQKDSLLQLKGLAIATGRLKKTITVKVLLKHILYVT